MTWNNNISTLMLYSCDINCSSIIIKLHAYLLYECEIPYKLNTNYVNIIYAYDYMYEFFN